MSFTYVQEDDFRQECANDKDEKDVEKPLVVLLGASNLRNNSSPQALGSHHTQAAD